VAAARVEGSSVKIALVTRSTLVLAIAAGVALGAWTAVDQPNRAILLQPDHPEWSRRAPEVSHVRIETSRGTLRLEMRRAWAPRGVDRFYNLVRHGFYDEARIFRIRAGTWAQFGINGDPQIAQRWRHRTMPDDPRVESNVRGTVAFAFRDPNGRSTQVFVNLRDNSASHDREPFVPFAKVVEGMETADAWFSEYGEQAGGGIRAGKQDPVFLGGNDYLIKNFPKLDYIIKAEIEDRNEERGMRNEGT
jgi:cyclophilin family peptidyl-prolyl cis-trans isomerase